MNLWAKAQRHLLMRAKTRMLNSLQIFSNNTSIPIVLTENDSIINTVNIDEHCSDNRAIAFLSDKKMKMILL
jgi:hypothetical protein